MLDFMMVWERRGLSELNQIEERVRVEVDRLLPARSDYYQAWFSRDGQAAVLLWGRNSPPIAPAKRVHRTDDGLQFFSGWLIDAENAKPILDVESARLDSATALNGEFTACVAHADGEMRFWRNIAGSMPLYYSREADRFILASRASVAAYGRHFSSRFRLSKEFSRSVLSASIALNDHSLFDGVYSLAQGATVYRPAGGRPVVHSGPSDLLFDEKLKSQYTSDRKSFWDDAFERLRGTMAVFQAADVPLEFPLSGGKDSRLLLGMLLAAGYRDRIQSVTTWGATGSPELRSAASVAEVLGLESIHRLRISDGNSAGAPVNAGLVQTSRYPRHVFLTEGEMSPMDLTGMTPRPGMTVSGQEGGLRNIAGKRYFRSQSELLHWFRVHLGNWDFCKILSDDARVTSEQEFLDYYGRQLLAVDDYNQLPTKHRIEFRFRRWVARTWHIANSTSFSPYVFPNDSVLRYTYNSGARSRSLEEFHFEMMRRADERLLEIPFAEQTWDPELADRTDHPVPNVPPYTWAKNTRPLSRRPVGLMLQARLDEIRASIESRDPEVLDGVIDMQKLRDFDAGQMRPGHVQPLMHLLTFLIADSVTSFDQLDVHSTSVGSFEVPDFDSIPFG